MKKALFITLFSGIIALSAFSQAKKFGHIDSQKIITELPEWKQAEVKLQEFGKKKESQIQAMLAEYQTQLAEYQKNVAGMTQTEKEATERELVEMEGRIQNARQKAQEDLAKLEQELMQPMVEKVKKAIKDVGDEGNFIYVFDLSTLLYNGGGEDITPLVKQKLAGQ